MSRTRFRECFQLGLPRENLSTGLNLILAQALIKKLCERCKIVDRHPAEDYDRQVYKSVGCPDCFNKGTRGRTAMAELLYFNEEVKEWVEDRDSRPAMSSSRASARAI